MEASPDPFFPSGRNTTLICRRIILVVMLSVSFARIARGQDREPIGDLLLHPKCEQRLGSAPRTLIRLDEARLMYVGADGQVVFSHDDGKTWTEGKKIPPAQGTRFAARSERHTTAIKARSGVIAVLYLDWGSKDWRSKDKHLHVWSVRSLDDGQTWTDRQMIFDGYCGAIMDMIQTQNGQIVAPVQAWLPDRGRHGQYTYVSSDDGKTWTRSNLIDAEETGTGDSAGTFEGTLSQLKDGRLWMLMRTTEKMGRFWQAFSRNNGLTWEEVRATAIDTSSSPAALTRLHSGRLVMVWNRLQPSATGDFVSAPSNESTAAARRSAERKPKTPHREELSLAFSEDDGRTWTEPAVIAKQKGNWLAYPRVFEIRPGELWIDTAQGELTITLHEKDFVNAGSSFSYPQTRK